MDFGNIDVIFWVTFSTRYIIGKITSYNYGDLDFKM